MAVYPDKTKYMNLSDPNLSLWISDTVLQNSESERLLGIDIGA